MSLPTKQIDVAGIATDVTARFEFLQAFVGFSADDWQALGDSLGVLGPHLPGVLDRLYEHLLSFDDTRRIFLGSDGDVSPEYIEIRKEHLTEWILQTATAESASDLAQFLAGVGRRHTGAVGDPDRRVPPRYMVGLVGFVQGVIVTTLTTALPDDPATGGRMAGAWVKMLAMQLELFLREITPHWPNWD